jgi:hypothetical protein
VIEAGTTGEGGCAIEPAMRGGGRRHSVMMQPMHRPFAPPLLRASARVALAGCTAALLSACAMWTAGDAPPRTSVLLSEPGSMGRSPQLHRLVTAMDAEAFPHPAGLRLKLSYQITPGPRAVATRGPGLPAGS